MKSLMLCGCFLFTAIAQPSSAALLDCNTPYGSANQQFTIFNEGEETYVKELYGTWSKPILLPEGSWEAEDMQWTSIRDGSVHLYKEGRDWRYDCQNNSVRGTPDCGEL